MLAYSLQISHESVIQNVYICPRIVILCKHAQTACLCPLPMQLLGSLPGDFGGVIVQGGDSAGLGWARAELQFFSPMLFLSWPSASVVSIGYWEMESAEGLIRPAGWILPTPGLNWRWEKQAFLWLSHIFYSIWSNEKTKKCT